ncbi:MAG: GntR family transcriptional regulator [Inquilinus sp.]|nr:GntR family transcriptional regulator [Inquilinus sp.]
MDPIQQMPGYRPLYQQVIELLRRRISDGTWRPDEALPSEGRLAAELGVSQGTVRKALDDLAAQHLVVRRQGRGTFVAAHSPDTALFHFFHLVDADGDRQLPESELLDCRKGIAGAAEAAALGLRAGAVVLRIDRRRSIDGDPIIVERIVVPQALFPDLDSPGGEPLPNTLYDLYQRRYGVTVGHAVERLRAVAAEPEEAAQLAVAPGTPLLEIDRIARDIEHRPVEWRVSRCLTDKLAYLSELT